MEGYLPSLHLPFSKNEEDLNLSGSCGDEPHNQLLILVITKLKIVSKQNTELCLGGSDRILHSHKAICFSFGAVLSDCF